MWLINDVNNSTTRGGEAIMLLRELKDKLQVYIFKVHSNNGTLHMLPSKINDCTLNSLIATIIKSQCVFDIYDTVANKTESRAVAEWSLRSTLAYTMIVACNHFLPNIEPTYFHPKKKDLNKDAIALWDIAELAYNKLIGNSSSKEKRFPVLPNRVTTTDKVTIFATAGAVNFKGNFLYFVKT